jgi:hypothetical protein
MIFSIVYYDHGQYPPWPHASDSRGWVHGILVLRWVSRRFRLLVDDLDIWRKDGFDLTEEFDIPDCTPLMKAQVVGTLLKDEGLVSAISPKRAWSFEYLEMLDFGRCNAYKYSGNASKCTSNRFDVYGWYCCQLCN